MNESVPGQYAFHRGHTLGKYKLEGLIGRGGMAEVYRSRHPELDRDLAVKILHPFHSDAPGFIERFRREANASASLRHPGIVQIYDFDVSDDGLYYMVMEYIKGQSLEEYLTKDAPLTIAQTMTLFTQIADAVGYAHQHNTIHRDIKPANILINGSGHTYLTDFGIAQIVGRSRLTQSHSTVGTPLYMAPEQVKEHPPAVSMDIYSLGMLLYHMLTNRFPYASDTPAAILAFKLTEPPASPWQYRPDLPQSIEQIIMKALAQDPADRFPNVATMVTTLAEAVSCVPNELLTAEFKLDRLPDSEPVQETRIDHYEIKEMLPYSGTSLCQRYLAHHLILDKPVILEVLGVTVAEARKRPLLSPNA